MRRAVSIAAIVLLSLGAFKSSALADERAVLARTEPDIVLLWKINETVDDLTKQGRHGEELRNAILARAVHLAAVEVSGDKKITIALLFEAASDDPRYKVETMGSLKRVGSVSAMAADLRKNRTNWENELRAGKTPSRLSISLDPEFTLLIVSPQ